MISGSLPFPTRSCSLDTAFRRPVGSRQSGRLVCFSPARREQAEACIQSSFLFSPETNKARVKSSEHERAWVCALALHSLRGCLGIEQRQTSGLQRPRSPQQWRDVVHEAVACSIKLSVPLRLPGSGVQRLSVGARPALSCRRDRVICGQHGVPQRACCCGGTTHGTDCAATRGPKHNEYCQHKYPGQFPIFS